MAILLTMYYSLQKTFEAVLNFYKKFCLVSNSCISKMDCFMERDQLG